MNRRLKRIFPVIAFMLLIPWPVAYGYAAGDAAREPIQVTTAEAAARPTWAAFGKAVGGVTAGDLFYIDATDNPADISVNLYLTNAPELIRNYEYLILKVGFYSQAGGGDWYRVTGYNGGPAPGTYLTMRNGRVGSILPGQARYRVSIDTGSFYCYGAGAGEAGSPPVFYLEVN